MTPLIISKYITVIFLAQSFYLYCYNDMKYQMILDVVLKGENDTKRPHVQTIIS